MLIPKKIHYCWFGRGKKPELVIHCINSWKKHLPYYELILWNEENFDINSNQYVKEAYESKRYAFVTDYVRLYALYHHGGIYMDTDVEVLKPLDEFLNHRVFIGCQQENAIQTGLIDSVSNHIMIEKILNSYNNKKFILNDGSPNLLPNLQIVTPILIEHFH